MNDTTAPEADGHDTTLDALVGEWLTLPDVAAAIGTDVGKVRTLVSERQLVGVRRGARTTFQVPAAFLVDGDDGVEVLGSVRGTVLVLSDSGMPDDEILRWMFDVEPALGATPVAALRSGRKHEVRRIARSLG